MAGLGEGHCLCQQLVRVITVRAVANANELRLTRDHPQARLLEGEQLQRVRAGQQVGQARA